MAINSDEWLHVCCFKPYKSRIFFAEKYLEIKTIKSLHDHKSSPYKSGVVKESVQIVVWGLIPKVERINSE